jgi:hypothetical protein
METLSWTLKYSRLNTVAHNNELQNQRLYSFKLVFTEQEVKESNFNMEE